MSNKHILVVYVTLVFNTLIAHTAEKRQIPSYERIKLSDTFLAEGANFGDINGDGVMDLVAGPYWFAGPEFTERVKYYDGKQFDIEGYSDNFFAFVYDVDQDGLSDIVIIGFPGKEARWYQNPGSKPGFWPMHIAYPTVDNESPTFTDITGDGLPELVFHTGGRLGFAQINNTDPTDVWEFHPISEDLGYPQFTHGLGVGDVNGDGRSDLLLKDGWWEQPDQFDSQQMWTYHPFEFADFGGAQMLVTDVDGDGDNDVITSKHAHAFGLAWFENVQGNGAIDFREHLIMGERPGDSPHGVVFSQLHALALADLNGDGIDDIVTGKRFWAHRGKDPEGGGPSVLYGFVTVRNGQQVHFEPHRIDIDSGVGTQVVAGDINSDGQPDVVVGNKKGIFVFRSNIKSKQQGTN